MNQIELIAKRRRTMTKLEEKLIKKLKRQNLNSDIIWFLIFVLFAVLIFVIRK